MEGIELSEEEKKRCEKASHLIKGVKNWLEIPRSDTAESPLEIITGLMYLSSENLVKHSKHLTGLTWALFVTALVLIGLTIVDLVL